MARLATNGGEWRHRLAEDQAWPATGSTLGGMGAGNNQTIVHSPGGSSVKVPFNPAPGDGVKLGAVIASKIVVGRRYYVRVYFYMDNTFADGNSTPAPYVGVLGTRDLNLNGANQAVAVITTSNGSATPAGRLGLFVTDGSIVRSQIGSYTSALALNTWHCLELSWLENTSGTVELRLNGTVVASGTATVTQSTGANGVGGGFWEGSAFGNATANAWYYDDFAVNDDQGADQNSYPGEGFVYLLTPTSDQARSSWTAGAGGTTNLWDAVNNLPPVGVVASLTNTSQIINAAKTTTENYDGLCPAYSSLMGAGETIKLAMAICNDAETGSGTKTGCVYVLSNPAQTEPVSGGRGFFNFGDDGGAPASAFPGTGWTTHSGPISYSGFTAGTAPAVRVGKRTSSSATVYCDELGIIFETAPALVSNAELLRPAVIGQALQRSVSWMKRKSGIVVPRLWTPTDGAVI